MRSNELTRLPLLDLLTYPNRADHTYNQGQGIE